MSAGNINILLHLWAAHVMKHGNEAPFRNAEELYHLIDSTEVGDVKWQSFTLSYQENSAMMNASSGTSCQDAIAEDQKMHGASFVPIILGSDKTTVSVATGQNEYYPLYMSIGNPHNNVRRVHRDTVALISFLAILKTDRRYTNDPDFRKFRRQLFHTSLSHILKSLKPGMTIPQVVRCSDGHFRHVLYRLGPYIADYPEQALLACIIQGWCPKCTASKMDLDGGANGRHSCKHTELLVREFELGELWADYGIIGDIVLIKRTFKDHLVDWVKQYFSITHGNAQAKVWLPAIVGYVPPDMIRAIRAFLKFCYIARCNVYVPTNLEALEDALTRFHQYRIIFEKWGVCIDGFSLLRQHSLKHYKCLIWEYGTPNGLCTSITESKHITAVKEPWWQFNRYNALGQMLLTNQRLDKLAASHVDFSDHGLLEGSCLSAEHESLRERFDD
ncbi:uncharacterized protein LAESUDRAFT_713557 [Laetiporus sulphureus 93-53]|uniref:CxC2-like cysteine cluster KDZ transposase-associated domain-containing protein n=1 Tax=Laetiporus sulphureus 93-53 TaxID=1314785 RepID=A0A165ENT8_9APHY|nr:uncharacterized protein LAESUDRAFT_713557 [Laetiporus sulphureus 93-53]KZT07450.1 hypothetical protein LAESUDRAFT_713557 [Laetiporus sulphureus 93-53]